MMRLILIALMAILATAEPSQAQQRIRAYATMDSYLARLQQARIRAVTTELYLGYAVLNHKYEMTSQILSKLRADQSVRSLVTVGPYGHHYRVLEAGAPSLSEPATATMESLRSILDRMEAGDEFDPLSSERFLGHAQRQLLLLAYYDQERARAALQLRRQVYYSQPSFVTGTWITPDEARARRAARSPEEIPDWEKHAY